MHWLVMHREAFAFTFLTIFLICILFFEGASRLEDNWLVSIFFLPRGNAWTKEGIEASALVMFVGLILFCLLRVFLPGF
jgi:hypothetical protein